MEPRANSMTSSAKKTGKNARSTVLLALDIKLADIGMKMLEARNTTTYFELLEEFKKIQKEVAVNDW